MGATNEKFWQLFDLILNCENEAIDMSKSFCRMQAKMFGLQTEKKSLLELAIQDGERQIYLDPMNGPKFLSTHI